MMETHHAQAARFLRLFLRPKSMSSPENANHRANPVHSRGVSVMLKQLYLIQST
jgi:hypothetical protein